MGPSNKPPHPAKKMRCAIILFICILSSASSPTAADEYYNQIVPEEEYQEPNDVDFSVDDDILTESPPGENPCAGVPRREKRAAKKAAKAKHDALIAAKKAMQEKDFKKVEKLYSAAAKNCAGAKEDAKKAKADRDKARQSVLKWKASVDTCVEEARKHENKEKAKAKKHELDEKTKKERDYKMKEVAHKKAEADKKEKAEKEKVEKVAEKADKKEKAGKEKAVKAKE